ncbi:XcbB/CpsF family capsular polysaccharide biosynthesis protein [Staphylococcus succinus]|uniref:accessory Sec system protein Asp2 n=2 Tax=Staphylococcus succinus TaxID=61015 RepID=UPI002DBF9A52|nr:accessory Sec system protein Asp2 [Staphylococcus succinus]MEB8209448.1 XcbB/CpsF family capsular polysaccharide biosynthesis protein [Staphylococcus succinus]
MIKYNLYEDIDFNGQEKIFIDTNDDKNMLEIARKDSAVKDKYKELLKNDYILYLHKNSVSRFCKREHTYKLFSEDHKFKKYKHILYRLNEPAGRKINDKVPKKLLVIFARMPSNDMYDDAKIPNRMFPPTFNNIERSLIKNVYIMRIMDLNVSHGSFYVNTINNNTYEKDIQDAIKNVMKSLSIVKDNVVFYGFSRGGSGALYHGALSDFKTLAVDPLLNIGDKLFMNDRRFLKGLRTEDVLPKINRFLAQAHNQEKFVICCENVKLYYEQVIRLDKKNINLIKLEDDNIVTHSDVSPNSVPEQLLILNYLLGGKHLL